MLMVISLEVEGKKEVEAYTVCSPLYAVFKVHGHKVENNCCFKYVLQVTKTVDGAEETATT